MPDRCPAFAQWHGTGIQCQGETGHIPADEHEARVLGSAISLGAIGRTDTEVIIRWTAPVRPLPDLAGSAVPDEGGTGA